MLNLFSVELLCKNNVTKAELRRCCLQIFLDVCAFCFVHTGVSVLC